MIEFSENIYILYFIKRSAISVNIYHWISVADIFINSFIFIGYVFIYKLLLLSKSRGYESLRAAASSSLLGRRNSSAAYSQTVVWGGDQPFRIDIR